MTLGTSGLLLLLAGAGIWLSARYLRAKPTLRIVCITVLSLFALLCIAYIGLTLLFVDAVQNQPPAAEDGSRSFIFKFEQGPIDGPCSNAWCFSGNKTPGSTRGR